MQQRKRTGAEAQRYIDRLLDLSRQESQRIEDRLKRDLIPADWHRMDELAPVTPRKTRVTIRLDTRTVRWFRATGTGWHNRIDGVLRAYMLAVVSKEIETHRDRDWNNDPI